MEATEAIIVAAQGVQREAKKVGPVLQEQGWLQGHLAAPETS